MDFDEFKALIFRGRYKKYETAGSDTDASSTSQSSGTKSMSNSSSAYSNMSTKSTSGRNSSLRDNVKKLRTKHGYESVGQEDYHENFEMMNQNISVRKKSLLKQFEEGISRLMIRRGKQGN